MDEQPDTRPMTNLLKGLAILAVVANHFVTLYVAPTYNGYGNGFIAFFFIFSGYGLYHSLARCGRLSTRGILRFWGRRLLRIYPLYWLSLMLLSALDHQSYSVRVYLAYPLRQAPGIFWFVTSIVQCYLLAPLLFWLLKKLGPIRYLLLAGLLMLLSAVAYPLAEQPYSMTHFVYRWLFLSHLILFALGMALPPVLLSHPALAGGRLRLTAAAGIFLVVIYLTNSEDFLFAGSARFLAPVFVMAAVWFCLTALSPRRLPNVLYPIGLAGIYSYSVYLFHLLYFKWLEHIGWVGRGGASAIGYGLLTLPLFLAACAVTDRLVNAVLDRAAAVAKRSPRPDPSTPGR